LDVITFNALFPGLIENTPRRLQAVTDMILDADADVLCLQEVFLPEEIEYVSDKLESAGYEVYFDFLQV
jgi:mRNA deadenylase 3'-5' endonuclease subunit Ccr4